jgi:uncharacterized membrane protein
MYEGSYTPPPVPPPPPVAPPPAVVPPSGGAVSPNRNAMIALSYLWLLALVPLLTEKEDSEVQWHAKHGLVLMIAEFILWVGMHFVVRIASHVTAGIAGCVFLMVYPVIALAILALHVVCIVKGTSGQRFTIPRLSDFASKM